MPPKTIIPVQIEPEAAARIEELGMGRQLDQMLEFLKQNVPGLRAIAVGLDAEANPRDEASIIITTHQPDPGAELDPSYWSWLDWFAESFPPEVCWHFVRQIAYETPDGR
jgi:hypothetical protein